jgi:hypothetical protein
MEKNATCLLIDVRISGLDASILLFPFLLIDVRISGYRVSTEKNLGNKISLARRLMFASPGMRLQGRKKSICFLSTPLGTREDWLILNRAIDRSVTQAVLAWMKDKPGNYESISSLA